MPTPQRLLLKIERECLEELKSAVSQAAEQAAKLVDGASRQAAIETIQRIAAALTEDVTRIIVKYRDATIEILAVVTQVDSVEDYDDVEDEARATAAATSFSAAWLLTMVLALAAQRSLTRSTSLMEYRLRRIATTEVFQAYNTAAAAYEAAGATKTWSCALERTCAACITHDGETVPVGKPFKNNDSPPMHPNCRCVIEINENG